MGKFWKIKPISGLYILHFNLCSRYTESETNLSSDFAYNASIETDAKRVRFLYSLAYLR